MRPKERIPIFIKHVNIEKLITDWFANTKIPSFEIKAAIKRITTSILYLTQYWQDNPDLRFSQILVNTGYLPNIPGTWYYESNNHILIKQGCKPRNVILWGNVFDKEGNRLPKPKWILIRDLTTDHIEAILISEKLHLNPVLIRYFMDELEYRKKATVQLKKWKEK